MLSKNLENLENLSQYLTVSPAAGLSRPSISHLFPKGASRVWVQWYLCEWFFFVYFIPLRRVTARSWADVLCACTEIWVEMWSRLHSLSMCSAHSQTFRNCETLFRTFACMALGPYIQILLEGDLFSCLFLYREKTWCLFAYITETCPELLFKEALWQSGLSMGSTRFKYCEPPLGFGSIHTCMYVCFKYFGPPFIFVCGHYCLFCCIL